MTDEPTTGFIEEEVTRDTHEWYSDFTEHWSVSVSADANADPPVQYHLRVVGPQGEVCKATEMLPDSTPPEIREKFAKLFDDASEVV